MTINYKIAKSKAMKLKRTSFGFTNNIMDYNAIVLQKISLDELTHLVAISFFRSQQESRNFYSCLSDEFRKMGYGKNRKGYEGGFKVFDTRHHFRFRQLYNLYNAVGLRVFYEFLMKPLGHKESKVRNWTNKALAKRSYGRPKPKTVKKVREILEKGGRIRFSNTSASVYIENKEFKIRISDHAESNNNDFDMNIIIEKSI